MAPNYLFNYKNDFKLLNSNPNICFLLVSSDPSSLKFLLLHKQSKLNKYKEVVYFVNFEKHNSLVYLVYCLWMTNILLFSPSQNGVIVSGRPEWRTCVRALEERHLLASVRTRKPLIAPAVLNTMHTVRKHCSWGSEHFVLLLQDLITSIFLFTSVQEQLRQKHQPQFPLRKRWAGESLLEARQDTSIRTHSVDWWFFFFPPEARLSPMWPGLKCLAVQQSEAQTPKMSNRCCWTGAVWRLSHMRWAWRDKITFSQTLHLFC